MEWLKKWKKDVKLMEQESRDLKKRLRTDWRISYPKYGDASKDQNALLRLREDLTSMYQFRAGTRGKSHTTKVVNGPKNAAEYVKLRNLDALRDGNREAVDMAKATA